MKDLINKISYLKQNKDLHIITSYIVHPIIQSVSDCVGDFLSLYNFCKNSDKRVFFYCGPDYIINYLNVMFPNKIFFKIFEKTKCSLSDYVTNIEIKELKKMYPLAKLAVYYKADLKVAMLGDILIDDYKPYELLNQLDSKQIIVAPDYNIGYFIACKNNKEIIVSHSYCNSLYSLTIEKVSAVKLKHPEAKIIIHPEVNYHIHESADYIMGYEECYDFFKTQNSGTFILCYNKYFIQKVKNDFKNVTVYKPDYSLKCFEQKSITLEILENALNKLSYKVELSDEIKNNLRPKLQNIIDKSYKN